MNFTCQIYHIQNSGTVVGALKHITNNSKDDLLVEILNEAIKTSEIEGEFLNRESRMREGYENLGHNYSVTYSNNTTYFWDGDTTSLYAGKGYFNYYDYTFIENYSSEYSIYNFEINGALGGGLGFDFGFIQDNQTNWGFYFSLNGNVGLGGSIGFDLGTVESTANETLLLSHMAGRSYAYDIAFSSLYGGIGINKGGNVTDGMRGIGLFNKNNFGYPKEQYDGYKSTTGTFSGPGKVGLGVMWQSKKTWYGNSRKI